MNKTNHFGLCLTSSFLLLVILFCNQISFGQIPKDFQEFIEKQYKIKSGYVKFKSAYMTDNDTTGSSLVTGYFIYTPNDYKYFCIDQRTHHTSHNIDLYCKSGKTELVNVNGINGVRYWLFEQSLDATEDEFYDFQYPNFKQQVEKIKQGATFVKIAPKVDKKNIRYKIIYPDDEMNTDNTIEWEFNRKTLNWVHEEHRVRLYNTERFYGSREIIEFKFYDYIHPDILDTITFRYEELRKKSDQQKMKELHLKDSLLREKMLDSIMKIAFTTERPLYNTISENEEKDTLKYMPSWEFPRLSGGTLHSDSITSRYLLIDLWYVGCVPCRVAMKELGTIDTLFDKSLVMFLSVNVADKDSAKIRLVVNNIGFDSEIVCTHDRRLDTIISRNMGDCRGFPQLYMVDMKTKQVVWRSCGYFEGFTKEIVAILRKEE